MTIVSKENSLVRISHRKYKKDNVKKIILKSGLCQVMDFSVIPPYILTIPLGTFHV